MNLAKNAVTDNLRCSFVIFGATGNLASNKLLPALYHLEAAARLSESLSLIAFSRREWTTDSWREHMPEVLRGKIKGALDTPVFERFIARFSYLRGDLNDNESYRALANCLPPEAACSSTVFYLAIKPAEFGAVIQNLEAVGLNKPRGINRVVARRPAECTGPDRPFRQADAAGPRRFPGQEEMRNSSRWLTCSRRDAERQSIEHIDL